MRLVLLTGDRLRHRHFANRLAATHDLIGIVAEPAQTPIAGNPAEARVIERHFQERDAVEEEFFHQDIEWPGGHSDVLLVAKGAINGGAVREWLSPRRAELLVVYGSSIVGPALLAAWDGRAVNLHLGLSPYYRGSGTNFWPLVNREPELVGATIHLLTSRLDGGPILAQVRPAIESSDRNHQIGCRAIEAGALTMVETLSAFAGGRLSPVPQSARGRLYRRNDFTAAAVEAMWRQFDTGMIPEYLADLHRARRYPIVELAA